MKDDWVIRVQKNLSCLYIAGQIVNIDSEKNWP